MHKNIATLLVMLGLFAGMAPCERAVVPIDQPQFIQVEAIEAGLGPSIQGSDPIQTYIGHTFAYPSLRVFKLTYHSPFGLRAGISALDYRGIPDVGYPWGFSVAPVHVGYDIVLNPRRMAFFYGMVPSCYVEATLGAIPPYAKLAAACDIDCYGVGTGIEVGCLLKGINLGSSPELYAALKLRLLDATFRLRDRDD